MPGKHSLISQFVAKVFATSSDAQLVEKLSPHPGPSAAFPGGARVDAAVLERRWKALKREDLRAALGGGGDLAWAERNIENAIGSVALPLAVAGPLRVNGLFAAGDYWVPLATTEAALVASYHRGCRLLTAAGGCTSVLLNEALVRAPAFVFRSVVDGGRFAAWITTVWEQLQAAAATTTTHGRLVDMGITVEGTTVWLSLEFTTGDASGQNMVTLSTEAVCAWIAEHSPIPPLRAHVEGNLSGDKKASATSFTSVRGRKVTAEVHLPADLLQKHLHATPLMMTDYWRLSALGGVQSGTIGVHGHFANGLAALYIATGQDAACVAESAVGVTRFEQTEGGLYASVTLPALMVGTVGGGTGLPSQRACLELMGLRGEGKSRALAEVCAGLLLAGELSIIAALAAGHFTRAHQRLARGRKPAV
jgi:hydroxymethylglutaryl-CoA reductase (NADPH)